MKKVELGGQKRPIRFSYLCLKAICNKLGLKLNELNQLGTEIEHIGVIAYFGFKYGAKKQGEKFAYKISDIEEWLDNEDFTKINEIFEAFQLDQPQGEGK
jgi:hypothetical protein|tara:strand:+ start:172 stop:471 length:300 start_codon:yes stop_codon:yes gene_type:complete